MRIRKIPHSETGHYIIFEATDIEFADPIKYYSELYINSKFMIGRELLLANKLPFPTKFIDDFVLKKANNGWEEKYQEHLKTEIPNNFLLLLNSKSKDEQIKLLKGQSLTPDQLFALIFKAWTDFGFSFSQYSVEHHHNGIDTTDLPQVVVVKDDIVKKVGYTPLSDGQLKHAVKHRQTVVSKFFDNGNIWHCFFVTYKSLRGEETWKEGQPHFHYISDKFGIKRDVVLSELRSKNYKLGSLPHIDFLNFGDNK
jgi:hypothetical protein